MTDPNNTPLHIRDFAERLSAVQVSVRESPAKAMTGEEAERLASESPTRMVAQVEERIAIIERRLADVSGYDKRTGEAQYLVAKDSQARKALELELYNLQNNALPYTRQRAAEIAAAQASLPTAEERAAAALGRQARIDARALELVEEIEAKQKAERLLADRRRVGAGA